MDVQFITQGCSANQADSEIMKPKTKFSNTSVSFSYPNVNSMTRKYNFSIEQILEMILLYQARVPVSTIGAHFGCSMYNIFHHLKKFEKLGLMKFRSRSETVLTTLSKGRKIPKGEAIKRVLEWKRKFGKEGLIDILTVFLLTDGSADYNHNLIRLSSADETICKIFTDLLFNLDLNPRFTVDRRNSVKVIFAKNIKVKEILKEVYKRTPNTKHQPQRGTENWEIYLKQTQPSLSFLYSRPKDLVELCFRIAITLEGCVVAIKNKSRLVRPELRLTCFHPKLIEEWQRISNMIGLNMSKSEKRLRTCRLEPITTFLRLGGFVEGVKIGNNSRKYCGIEKNERLNSLLKEYYNRRK